MVGIFVPWNPKNPNGPGWTENESGCHIWKGGTTPKGYACGNDVRTHRVGKVYRIRYEREIGPIPDGMDLDHYVCNNGAGGCCNPHHCRPATRRENILRTDCPPAQCAAHTHCKAGHLLTGDNLIACDINKRGIRRCRICTNERQIQQHAKHREKRLARQREQVAANRDAINAKQRARAKAKTPEEIEKRRAYFRAYYAAHPEMYRLKNLRRRR